MCFEKRVSNFFRLKNQEDWLKHANLRSVATRIIILPLLILAIWSRVWIGWYSVIFLALLVLWSLINPTFFSKYTEVNNWWSKSVLGEYFWANREKIPAPSCHVPVIRILTFLQFAGGVILLVGLYQLDVWLTGIGTIVIYFSKMWFLDRMVWVYEEMRNHPEYKDIQEIN